MNATPDELIQLLTKKELFVTYTELIKDASPTDNEMELLKVRKEALIKYGPAFEEKKLELYLCHRVEDLPEHGSTTWFTFVDPEVLQGYVPPNALKASQNPSIIGALFGFKGEVTPTAVESTHRNNDTPGIEPWTGRTTDFSGSWQSVRLEGDMDSVLSQAGMGFVGRTASSASGHGATTVRQVICQEGDEIEVTDPGSKHTSKLRVGGGPQETVDLVTGVHCEATPFWTETGVLETIHRISKHPTLFTRRWIEGEEMVLEKATAGTSGGAQARRYFTRVEEDSGAQEESPAKLTGSPASKLAQESPASEPVQEPQQV